MRDFSFDRVSSNLRFIALPLCTFQVLSKTRAQLQATPGSLERVRDELLVLDGQGEGAGLASAAMLQVRPHITHWGERGDQDLVQSPGGGPQDGLGRQAAGQSGLSPLSPQLVNPLSHHARPFECRRSLRCGVTIAAGAVGRAGAGLTLHEAHTLVRAPSASSGWCRL